MDQTFKQSHCVEFGPSNTITCLVQRCFFIIAVSLPEIDLYNNTYKLYSFCYSYNYKEIPFMDKLLKKKSYRTNK